MNRCVRCQREQSPDSFYFYSHTQKHDRTCKECRRSFQAPRNAAAAYALRLRQRDERAPKFSSCLRCGESFSMHHARVDARGSEYLLSRTNKKFCSAVCRAKARREEQKKARGGNPSIPWSGCRAHRLKSCAVCGEAQRLAKRQRDRKRVHGGEVQRERMRVWYQRNRERVAAQRKARGYHRRYRVRTEKHRKAVRDFVAMKWRERVLNQLPTSMHEMRLPLLEYRSKQWKLAVGQKYESRPVVAERPLMNGAN